MALNRYIRRLPGSVVSNVSLCVALAGIIAAATPSFAQSPPDKAHSVHSKKKKPVSTPHPAPSAATAPAPSEKARTPGEPQHADAYKAQNPIATQISIPFQNNMYFRAGPYHQTENVLLVEPVIPFKLSDQWNLITRWITPIVSQPRVSPTIGTEAGLGNMLPQFYLSPAQPGEIVWGLGPQVFLPTATDSTLGINKLGGGPAGVALMIHAPWLVGVLINNVWAGSSGRQRVNQFTLNPFVYYNMPEGWYVVSSTSITADWTAKKSKDIWTAPLGGGLGRIFKIGEQSVNARVQAFYNVVRPPDYFMSNSFSAFAPIWQVQFQIQFLFPQKS